MITYIIIAVTCLVSYQAFNNQELFEKLSFKPYKVVHNKEYYRLITNGFVHADWTHLFFNMLTLYFFGRTQEQIFTAINGEMSFILFYLLSIPASSLISLYQHKDDPRYSAIGASGAVNAILFSFILINPFSTIYIFVIPIKAIIFAVLFLIYSSYMAKKNMDNIGHEAHISGAIFGVLFTILTIPNVINHFISQF
jgi:membrane associated rhomboid family serine protease